MRHRVVLSLAILGILTPAWPAAAAELPFGPPITVEDSLLLPLTLASGDIDGDGLADLVAAGALDSNLTWWRSLGNGTFSQHIIATGIADIIDVHTADLDGDGDLDLVAAAAGDSNVVGWFVNDGTPADGPWTLLPIAILFEGADAVATGDFDADGDLDVVALAATDGLAVALNANGAATSWTYETVDATFGGGRWVTVGDVDGDGHLDVASASQLAGTISWWKRAAGGGSWAPHSMAVFAGANPVELADMDGDGDLDAVSGAATNTAIRWLENDGTGGGWVKRAVGSALDTVYACYPVDMDHDGDMDVVYVAGLGHVVGWMENTAGDGMSWTNRVIDGAFSDPVDLVAFDLDDDGDRDMAAVSTSGTLAVWTDLAVHRSALFQDSPDVVGSANSLTDIEIADVDGDGDLDLLTSDFTTELVAWRENTAGDGSAWMIHPVRAAFVAHSVTSGDLNGDGFLDLVGAGDASIRWWLSDGSDGWVENTIPTTQLLPRALAVADLDRDGDLDVVSGAFSGGVDWYANNGHGGSWTEGTVGPAFIWDADSMVLGDIDGDGDIDVIVADSDQVYWFPNRLDTHSNFGVEISVATSLVNPRSIAVGDVDNDGDLDLVGLDQGADHVIWWENTAGDGSTWGPAQAIAVGVSDPRSVQLADLDLDGDLDVAMVAEDRATSVPSIVAWYENDLDGADWFSHVVTMAGLRPGHLALGDLDGDGDPDLVSEDLGDNVLWWRNEGAQAAVETEAAGPVVVEPLTLANMLTVSVRHRGRAGDADMEPASLELQLIDGAGTPLTDAEADALVYGLYIFVDEDGSGDFDPALDSEVAAVEAFNLTDGRTTVTLPDMHSAMWASPSVPCTLFVAIAFNSDAASQSPNELKIVHLGASSTVEDRDHDLALTLEPAADVESGLARPLGSDLIFYDGFESSDTSAWSSSGT
jgi:hypothetical protein